MTVVPRYAVLFKTHFWDAFATRQLLRLCSSAKSGDVFVIVDETHGPVHGIPLDRIIRMTEAMSEAEGYRRYPVGGMFWHNTDYQLYHFIDRFPEYEYIVQSEYDCAVNIDLRRMVAAMAAKRLDFVGDRIREPAETWHWRLQARPYYDDAVQIVGRLVQFAAFSRAFALQLKAARQDHTRRYLAAEIRGVPGPGRSFWPLHEAFVGAEIARLGAAEAPLSAFGDMSEFDWAPPKLEACLPSLSHCAVIHPVLDGPRFIPALQRIKGFPVDDLFVPDSRLHAQMQLCDPSEVVGVFLPYYLRMRDTAAIERLRTYARDRMGERAERAFNVARGKPATQSSTCRWSRAITVSADAAAAVNGEPDGRFSFHTGEEPAPWWCVDLEVVSPVREIRIFNRLDQPHRTRTLVVSCSSDLTSWQTLYEHDGAADFGGFDGRPLKISLPEPLPMRFVRLNLTETQILNLDKVEVYV